MPSMPGPKRVYLDVCALCRPFDDQSAVRIRLETVAVELIPDRARQQEIDLIFSPAHDVEIEATADYEEHSHAAINTSIKSLGERNPRLILDL
jgi:hypothetical protein